MEFNLQDNKLRVIKYLIMGVIVALSCFAIPKITMDFMEILLIALVASSTFGILDTYLPIKSNQSIKL